MVAATNWPSKTVKVTNLMLDEFNVRLDVQHPSQGEIIRDLFENENTYQLVENIVRNGLFNNELPIVTLENGRSVVLEGNRRVAAIKAILNPSITPKFHARIHKLIDGQAVSALESIEVKMCPSREEAQKLISSIHTVRTRKGWRPLRQAYFYYAQLEGGQRTVEELQAEFPNVDIPEFVKMWEMHHIASSINYNDPETQKKVASRQFPISTLERLYDQSKFREHFGFDFDQNGEFTLNADRDQFEASFSEVIRDIVTKRIDSRSINKAGQLDKHLDSWTKPSRSKRTHEPIKSEAFEPVVPARGSRQTTALIPKDVVCSIQGAGVAARLRELQEIPFARYPNVAMDSLRSLLECSLKAYCDHKSISVRTRNPKGYVLLDDVLDAVLNDLKARNIQRKLWTPLGKIKNNQGRVSLKDELDSINHNYVDIATANDVKRAWDRIDAIVRYVLKPD